MYQIDLASYLQNNSYPGRGVLLGLHQDGKHGVIAYFIMGRSENSRNRIFVAEGEDMKTQAFDPSKMVDPSLIIYYPVRTLPYAMVVTNGDQTDTVYDALRTGGSFLRALRTRTFEPDADNYTPPISGIICRETRAYKLSILKSANHNPDSVQRFFYEYSQPVAGEGHLIHTYEQDGNPIPSFTGEPRPVVLNQSIDDFTDTLWNSLNPDNKVSLFVRYLDLTDGSYETRIVNKNQ